MCLGEASVFAYCLWHAHPLIQAWQKNPSDRFGWLALLIWMLPIAYDRFHHRAHPKEANTLLLALGLSLSFFGEMGSLNALKYAGLALSFASFTATITPAHALWLLSSIGWMPLMGWAGSHWFPGSILPVRLMIALTGAGICLPPLHSLKKKAISCPR